MAKEAVYYVARLGKTGNLTTDMVIQALLNSKPILFWGSAWSFVETKKYETNGIPYVCGRLSKYRPDAEVVVVDPALKTEVIQQEPNLRTASSVFVYIPQHSGVVFMRVPGHIETWHFADRFARIIEETYERFFVECEVRMITDLKTFAVKLASLAGIYRISAVIQPPNPLFGPLWAPLKEYIKRRRADQMILREDARTKKSLNTVLPEVVQKVADADESPFIPEQILDIGDAAILMAADGYGTGTVTGYTGKTKVVIKTSETNLNFTFDREPELEALFLESYAILERIRKERHMEHE